jgi:FAD/FMN-containing dehydrogenase
MTAPDLARRSWQNWSGRVTCFPSRIVRPRSEDELAATLALSAGPIRVVGSGHSFAELCATDGTLVDLDEMRGVISTDDEARTATVWAGTKLFELGEPLLARGLGLVNMGDIDRQSLAGAISTGTHGTGRTLGNISSSVVGLRMVLPDGQVAECSHAIEPKLLRVARVSLGVLGVITRVTLRCLPAYRLHQRTWPASFDGCMGDLEAMIAANRHFEFFWSPADDTCAMKALNPTDAPVGEIAPPPEATGRLPRYLAPERVDWSHRIFPSERNVRFNEMEFAVPAASGPACMLAIRDLMRTRHADVVWPVEFRTVAADDIPLSPAYGRESVTISIHQAAELPHERFFADAESIFREHGGRPHWGKLHAFTARDVSAAYTELPDFLSVRERLDPRSRMLSPYLRRLLLE